MIMLELQEPISGRYRLQHRLRRGGMSDVYLAYDELQQLDVAIKLVSSDDPDCMQRLQREVQTMSKLLHNHILPTLDYGKHGPYYYLAMPYMKRGTLRERIAKGRLTQQEAGHIFAQVASALQFAHEHSIIHRDIKPSNILIDDADKQYVYLADFGLAKSIGEGSDLTQTGCLIGTPEYMAPELIDMPESVSSDIYALGVLLYNMLTGRAPFTGGPPVSIYWKHIREQPLPPSHLNPAISQPVEQVILRALSKDPRHRFLSVKVMAQAFEDALQVSEHAKTALAIQTYMPPPALVTHHKIDSITLPAVIRQAVPWWQKPGREIQKVIVAFAMAMLVATPLSLGFLLAKDGAPEPLILSVSGQFASNIQQMHHASSSRSQTTAVVHSSSGNAYSSRFTASMPQFKRKHKHARENRDGNGNQNDDDSFQALEQ
jgi:serine/threonine protein kinase